ncbi:MAG: hypothetical protein NTZ56_11030 [Acidobacteria bacterium]|nr:hypothetical protein [Acidobacteriota bacterium]
MDEFDRKIAELAARGAETDERVRALLRVAELHQERIDHLDQAMATLADSMIGIREAEQRADERVAALVSAIGEFIRQRPQG